MIEGHWNTSFQVLSVALRARKEQAAPTFPVEARFFADDFCRSLSNEDFGAFRK